MNDTAQAVRFFKILPWEDESWMQRYYPVFDNCKESYQKLFPELLKHVPEHSPYLLLQMATGQNFETEINKCQNFFVQCMERTESAYLQYQAVKEAVLHGINLKAIVSIMDLDTWKQCAEKLKDWDTREDKEKLKSAVEKLVLDAPLYGLWLKKLLSEKELIYGYPTGDSLICALKEYSGYILQFYRIQYRDEVFSESKHILLSKDGRFAFFVWEALERMEQMDFPEAIRLFRRALRFCPSMTSVIREAIRQISQKAELPVQNTGEEFQLLARQMKEVLRAQIEHGQHTEALPIILQLSPLLPEDLELLRMRQTVLRETAE